MGWDVVTRRTAAMVGLPVLAVLVMVVGVLALVSVARTPRATAVATDVASPSPEVTASATASTMPTFTPSPSLPGADWLEYRGNTEATGVSTDPFITPSTVANLKLAWTGPAHQAYMGGSAIVGDVMYVTNGNSLFAHDLRTGKQLWAFAGIAQSFNNVTSTVAVDTRLGLAFYGSADTRVYAVNIRTGRQAWVTTLGDPTKRGGDIWSSPLIANGHVYIGLASVDDTPCVRGGVFALDEQAGAISWVNYTIRAGRTGGGVWSSVSANEAQQEILATTGNPCPNGDVNPTVDETDSFLAIDWNTGKTLWQYTAFGNDACDCDFGQGPVGFTYQGQDEVVGGNKNGFVYALRPPAARSGTPTLLWKTQITDMNYYGQGGIYTPPTYQDGVVYIAGGPTLDGACAQGSIDALRATDGTVLWRECTSGQVAGAPVLDNGMLFVAQYNTVVAYDVANGKTLWSASYQSQEWGGLAIGHGHLIVPLVGGHLLCYAVAGVSP
jgi:outer membrane protein assembly factor BamB